MTILEAVILGIVQGLTEFLPISSSGHLELGSYVLGTSGEENLLFAILVHGATALSTVVVFRKELIKLLTDVLAFKWNDGTRYVGLLVASMIPVGIAGIFFEDEIASLFSGDVVLVASMLLVTGTLLIITRFIRNPTKVVDLPKSLVIGIAQAIAIFPGISRSGATISTALFLGVERTKATRFSFLMVLAPILGAMLLKAMALGETQQTWNGNHLLALGAGFVASFVAGLFACRWMIAIVKKGNLIYFALYCYVVAISVLIYAAFNG